MKRIFSLKLVVLFAVVCFTSVAFATDYSLVGDWGTPGYAPNPNGNWSYGTKTENVWGSGVFNPFQIATIHSTLNSPEDLWWERWIVADTAETCNVGIAPGGLWSFPAGSVIANAWVNYAAVAHLTGVESGLYDLYAAFTGGGYAASGAGHMQCYVQVNGVTVWQGLLTSYTTIMTPWDQPQIYLTATDYVDFIVADPGTGEARASINATLTLAPEQPPQPPASISYPTSSTTGQYTVSWPSVSQAISYQLERSSDSGSSWSQVYSGENTSYPETISNGSYRYRVKATNSGGSSSWSAGAWDCAVSVPIGGCTVTLTADLNFDCVVNIKDLAVLGQQWMGIDYNNVEVLSEQWLKCTKADDPNCQSYIEPAMADKWMKQVFTGTNPTPPISFVYNGISSSTFLPTWNFSRTKTELDPNRTQWTLAYTEPTSGKLKVTCQVTEYHDYPAAEWITYFENIGSATTPIIENVQTLNMDLNCAGNPQGGTVSGAAWNAATNWNTAPPNPNGNWAYYGGWVAGWTKLNTYDNTAYPGLQRWSRDSAEPWVGKNTSANTITIDGVSVLPGQMVMKPGQGLGNCPAISWTCPTTSIYNLTITLKKIGAGGDGVDWNVHDSKWAILGSGVISSQGQTATFNLTNEPVGKGEVYYITFHSRSTTTGDLTLIDFAMTDVWPQWSNDFVLYHAQGSNPGPADFQPIEWCLGPGTSLKLTPSLGRSSDGIAVPFFGIQQTDNSGRILGIGWSGQWAAGFNRDSGGKLNIQAGMELTHLKLVPEEKIRMPAMMQFFWAGNRQQAQNKFRRFMLDHCSPTAASNVYANLNFDTDCNSVDNGTWSYGWGRNLSDFTLMDYQELNATGWYRDARGQAGGALPPVIWYNKQGSDLYYGVPRGSHSMHSPSNDSQAVWSKIRYHANQSRGTVTIEGIIGRGDKGTGAGKVDAKVVRNAGKADEAVLWSFFDASDNVPFSAPAVLNLNDTIDLLVGRGSDGYGFDSTNVTLTIHSGRTKVDPPVADSPLLNPWTEATLLQFINDAASHNLPVKYIWMDAGWYDCGDSWVNTGTWEPHPVLFPNGLDQVAATIHNNDFKFLLWFEPERVVANTWLSNNHQEWLLGAAGGWQLLNMGDPTALAWAKNKFSGMVAKWHVDCYRHDFNHYPLSYWRNADASDRQGIAEIRYITGLYEYFDTLLADHPSLILDNCASGGKRLDFEMWRRSLALWRSDYCWDAGPEQCFTYGLSQWVPVTGRGSTSLAPYHFRSGMGSHFTLADWITPAFWDPATTQLNQLGQVREFFTGDFYPLTNYSLEENVWMAWQFDRPDISGGIVQVFRRPNNTVSTMNFKLQGLDPAATYKLTDMDGIAIIPNLRTGSDLMNNGYTLVMATPSSARIITYTKN